MTALKLLLASLAALALLPSASAAPETHGYDDLPHFVDVGAHYPDYAYIGATTLCDPNYNVDGYPFHSGPCVVYSASSGYVDIEIAPALGVDGFSAYFSSHETALTITAFDASDNVLAVGAPCQTVYGTNMECGVVAPIGSLPIARIEIHDSGNYWTMDAATFNEGGGSTPPVPELGSLALAAAGLVGVVGLVAFRRRG